MISVLLQMTKCVWGEGHFNEACWSVQNLDTPMQLVLKVDPANGAPSKNVLSMNFYAYCLIIPNGSNYLLCCGRQYVVDMYAKIVNNYKSGQLLFHRLNQKKLFEEYIYPSIYTKDTFRINGNPGYCYVKPCKTKKH